MRRAALIAAVAVLSACGSSDMGSVAPAPEAGAGPVSLRIDVVPILVANCTTGDCHGDPDGANIYLGAPAASAASTYALLVGQPALELPSMPYVAAGYSENSYVMHKLDADLSDVSGCDAGLCGLPMPRGGAQLDAPTRATIRSWIAQGAHDN